MQALVIVIFVLLLRFADKTLGLGAPGIVIATLIAVSGCIYWFVRARSQREQTIKSKYSADVAQKILKGQYWIGQSREQLRDALGFPEKIETKESSRRTKEVWKFFHKDSNRVRLKITMTNGIVTQIDEK